MARQAAKAHRSNALTPGKSAWHLFGEELRKCRVKAGLSQPALAKIVGYSDSGISRVENGLALAPEWLPPVLDKVFDTDRFVSTYALARKARHPDQYKRRMEFEAQARFIDEYAPLVIPGLIQTPRYSHTLFTQGNPRATGAEISRLMADRASRRAVLSGDPAPDLCVVLEEQTVRHVIGSAEIMREQIEVLIWLAYQPTCTVQILPANHGAHPLIGGAVTLFTSADGSCVAHEESVTSGHLIEDPAEVAHHRCGFNLLRSRAMSPDDTITLLRIINGAMK